MTLLRDFRGQVSWGRVCSLVSLVVAVVGQFNGMSIEAVKVWLSVAVGNYGASKLTEIAACFKVGAAVPSAPGGGDSTGCVGTPVGTTQGADGGAL